MAHIRRQSTQTDSIWEAINLLHNLETYGNASDDELGELLGWFLQAEYGNAHEQPASRLINNNTTTNNNNNSNNNNNNKPQEDLVTQTVNRAMMLQRVPVLETLAYWKEYVGTPKSTAWTLFVAGVNRKFKDKQNLGVFFF